MSMIKLTSTCEITTGKLDANAAVVGGKYPYFTCAPKPLEIDTYAFDEDAILLAGNNAAGNFHCQRYNGKFNAYQRTYVITAKEGYDIDYIYYNLLINLKLFKRMSQGSQTKFLTMEILNSFELNDIPYKEQKQLVGSLVSIREKINNNNSICTAIDGTASALYEYWFVQFDFLGPDKKPYKSTNGEMEWNDSVKREIPKGWEVKQIGEIISEAEKSTVQVNESKSDGKYPFFTSGDSIPGYDEYFVDGFNCFLNTGGNPDVKGYKGKCAYSTDTWCINGGIYSYLMYYYFLSILDQFEQLFFTGSGLKHLQKDVLKKQFLVLPPKEIIDRFNAIMDDNWDKKTLCISENQSLESLQGFLLPMLMNGQVKVTQEGM